VKPTAHGNVYVVDDDPAVRDALGTILTMEGFGVTGFADGMSFVSAAQGHMPDCIILDVAMPGHSGLDLLKILKATACPAPVFAMSGQASIPMAVDAIRSGALDFFEKPFDADMLVRRVRTAIAKREQGRAEASGLAPHFPGANLLTTREREVLERIAEGSSNKEVGRILGISPRTVEVHRARIMEKLGARNAADLVRIVLSAH
jgi:FixJ family two-component response regulator